MPERNNFLLPIMCASSNYVCIKCKSREMEKAGLPLPFPFHPQLAGHTKLLGGWCCIIFLQASFHECLAISPLERFHFSILVAGLHFQLLGGHFFRGGRFGHAKTSK